jgi:hypothetical protein
VILAVKKALRGAVLKNPDFENNPSITPNVQFS